MTFQLRSFLRITLRISTAHDFRVISVHIQNINKMVAFLKKLGLQETIHHFFLGNEYQDLTIFYFSLNAEITFFLYSEYGLISIAE